MVEKAVSHPVRGTVAITGLVLLVAGCSSGGGNLPRTVPASGVVTLDGKPVDGAQVVFVPADAGVTGAYGVTDASGRFSLRAFEQKDGAIPGQYLVQVSKTIEVRLPGPAGSVDGGDPVRFEHGVPARYTNVQSSGLTATIPENGTKDLKFELKSK